MSQDRDSSGVGTGTFQPHPLTEDKIKNKIKATNRTLKPHPIPSRQGDSEH